MVGIFTFLLLGTTITSCEQAFGPAPPAKSVDWWLGSYNPTYVDENAAFIKSRRTTISGVLHCCRGVVMEPNGSLSSATTTTDGEFFQDLTAYEVTGGLNPVMIPVSPNTVALLNGVASKAVPELVAVAVARGFTGYVIDYEPHTNLTATHAKLLGAWLTALSSALHASKKKLAVCVSDWGIIGPLYYNVLAAAGADRYVSMGSTYGNVNNPAIKLNVNAMLLAFPLETVTVGIGTVVPPACNCVYGNVGNCTGNYGWTEATLASFVQWVSRKGIGRLAIWRADIYPAYCSPAGVVEWFYPIITAFLKNTTAVSDRSTLDEGEGNVEKREEIRRLQAAQHESETDDGDLGPQLLAALPPAAASAAAAAFRFERLPTGAVMPEGWLKAQLLLQADQLGSALPIFYAPINKSRWVVPPNASSVDGTCWSSSRGPPKKCGVGGHGGLHETFVYWLNGAVPLAAVLKADRPAFHATVESVVHALLDKYSAASSTSADDSARAGTAWFSAYDDQLPARSHTWSLFRMMTALIQWAEAMPHDAARIEAAVQGYLYELGEHLPPTGLNESMGWSYYRWSEPVSVAFWSIERRSARAKSSGGQERKNAAKHSARELKLARLLATSGFQWGSFLTNDNHMRYNRSIPDPSHPGSMPTHGVNVGQALQACAWQYKLSASPEWQANATLAIETVWKWHGQSSGMYSAEDNLAGLEPSKGTETCASNEAMVSLMVAAGAGATNADVVSMLDRAERIGFNALPGPWRGGQMWELQYHHQVNAFAAPQHEHAEGYDPDSLGYGLPYECCASNSQMGWPRLAQLGIVMASPLDGGLLLAGYMAATARLTTAAGVDVTVVVAGDYPFDDYRPITISITTAAIPARSGTPTRSGAGISLKNHTRRRYGGGITIPVWLRIPNWTNEPTLNVSEVAASASVEGGTRTIILTAGTLHRVDVRVGVTSVISLSLPMEINVQRRMHNAVSVHRGPLMYALPLNYTSAVVDRYFPPHGVDESLNASEPWREALVDVGKLKYRRTTTSDGGGSGGTQSAPWSLSAIRGVIDAAVRAVSPSAWAAVPCSTNFYSYNDDCAGPAPESPVDPSLLVGPARNVELVPFGAVDIGLGELPVGV